MKSDTLAIELSQIILSHSEGLVTMETLHDLVERVKPLAEWSTGEQVNFSLVFDTLVDKFL